MDGQINKWMNGQAFVGLIKLLIILFIIIIIVVVVVVVIIRTKNSLTIKIHQ